MGPTHAARCMPHARALTPARHRARHAASQLKRSLENRTARRQADKFARQEHADVYEGSHASRQGAAVPGASTVASLAAISALSSEPQEVIRCELCQVRGGGASARATRLRAVAACRHMRAHARHHTCRSAS